MAKKKTFKQYHVERMVDHGFGAQEYAITVFHDRWPIKAAAQPVTVVAIRERMPKGMHTFIGVSRLIGNDQFSRPKGREKAFEEALKRLCKARKVTYSPAISWKPLKLPKKKWIRRQDGSYAPDQTGDLKFVEDGIPF